VIADLLNKHLQTDTSLIHSQESGVILLRPLTPLEISASDIRKQIAMGRNPRYLLPNAVLDYLKQQRIYHL
jgi:nicotinate-nucleotide adenylyltransferase